MISYQFGQKKFNFRSVAILIIKNHVLLQREADDDFGHFLVAVSNYSKAQKKPSLEN
ncbi:MAG: hypothetical protein CENE_00754 [Candidatus Celerinatantimonas neptuna]|nr:MAG: hypothetical protein CENE_00754 [Candidatus Celerinatantimonas neptuna]